MCGVLPSVTVPSGVESIGTAAFGNCYKLREISFLNPNCVIPDERSTLGSAYNSDGRFAGTIYGFEGSTAQAYAEKYDCKFELLEIPALTTTETSATTTTVTTTAPATTTVPVSTDEDGNEYTEGTYEDLVYHKYEDHIVIGYCDESVEGEIIIPDEIDGLPVTEIGYRAFDDCVKITGVTIPDSVRTIKPVAFYGCTGLSEITIGSGVKEIGYTAFYNCKSLTSVTIPESVDLIDDDAFSNCESLSEITLLNPYCKISASRGTITNSSDVFSLVFTYDGVIRGYENSTAQEYAEDWEYKFESLGEIPVTLGDVDGDGMIDSADATVVLIAYAFIQTGQDSGLTMMQEKAADVDGDDTVSASDASKILAYYAAVSTGKNPSWDDGKWKAAYKEAMDSVIAEWGDNKDDITIIMPFIDNDDIPELCLVDSSDEKHVLYTFYNGSVLKINSGSIANENSPTRYGEKTGHLVLITAENFFDIGVKLCILENGSLNVIHNLRQIYDEDDYTRTCIVDGETVTEEEFDSLCDQWAELTESETDPLTYDDAIAYINSL